MQVRCRLAAVALQFPAVAEAFCCDPALLTCSQQGLVACFLLVCGHARDWCATAASVRLGTLATFDRGLTGCTGYDLHYRHNRKLLEPSNRLPAAVE